SGARGVHVFPDHLSPCCVPDDDAATERAAHCSPPVFATLKEYRFTLNYPLFLLTSGFFLFLTDTFRQGEDQERRCDKQTDQRPGEGTSGEARQPSAMAEGEQHTEDGPQRRCSNTRRDGKPDPNRDTFQ